MNLHKLCIEVDNIFVILCVSALGWLIGRAFDLYNFSPDKFVSFPFCLTGRITERRAG